MFKNKKTKDQNEINLQSPKLETQLLKKAFSYPGKLGKLVLSLRHFLK